MSRPTAGKRAVRRRYAILGVLAERGPSHALDLCKALARGPGTIYPDLAWMEHHKLVTSEWEDDYIARITQTMPPRPPDPSKPRRRIYRLPDSWPHQSDRRGNAEAPWADDPESIDRARTIGRWAL